MLRGGYSLATGRGLLIAVPSLVVEHGGLCSGGPSAPGLQSTDFIVVAPVLSCTETCGIFSDRDQTRVPCIVDSHPLDHQGSPTESFFKDIPMVKF